MKSTVVLCTLVLNEMEWLQKLYDQHKNWPGMLKWVFVESADRVYAETTPEMVNSHGLSVDGTTEFLHQLSSRDARIVHIKHGFCSHPNPAQGKCQSRTRYLREADKVRPDFLFILDGDEFYTYNTQAAIMEQMTARKELNTGYCFKHRHPWRPPSIADHPLFEYEVTGGFWDIPLCRGWRWFPNLSYKTNHNTPERPGSRLLDNKLVKFNNRSPECIHMAFSSDLKIRRAKHKYYAARGEGRVDFRGWYVESRACFETWKPNDVLPKNAKVVAYSGQIPECFSGSWENLTSFYTSLPS